MADADVRAQFAIPSAIANARNFRGQIRYSGHGLGAGSPAVVEGSLEIGTGRWMIEERSGAALLHADATSSWLRTGSRTLQFDDALAVEALANSWAVVLGTMATAGVQAGSSDATLMSGDGLQLYVDRASGELTGAVDRLTPEALAFSFGDWTTVNGLRVPQSLVRLRGGTEDGAFVVDHYDVRWAPADDARRISPNAADAIAAQSGTIGGTAPIANPAGSQLQFPWRQYGAAFGLLLLALFAIAWTRRDALAERICRTRSEDPRGWRLEGRTPFVSPEGYLLFENRRYKVGVAFYNRLTTIQSSPLFIRISAPGVPRAVVLFRKLNPGRASRRLLFARPEGFTLVEALVATAVFSIVVVGAVFPMLFVLAQADRLADQRQRAGRIASNAMVDEVAALEYGSAIQAGAQTFAIDGMDTSIGVSPSSVRGAFDVSVSVSDQKGHLLAKLVTMLGPPVAAPASASGSGG